MAKRWQCPFAVRKPHYEFLICAKFMKKGVTYNTPKEGVTAYCGHQRPCNCTHRFENTDEAQECYRYHSEQSD